MAGSFLANGLDTFLNNRAYLARDAGRVCQVRQEFACCVEALGRWIGRRFWSHVGPRHLLLYPVTSHDRILYAVTKGRHDHVGDVPRSAQQVVGQLGHALGHVYVGFACVQLLTDRALLAIHASAWSCPGSIVLIERGLVGGQLFDLLWREPFSAGWASISAIDRASVCILKEFLQERGDLGKSFWTIIHVALGKV